MSAAPARGSFVSSVFAVTLVVLTARVGAQCANTWLPTPAFPGVTGNAFTSIEWDPDGPGPRTAVLVLGGSFTVAGTLTARAVVAYDPVSGSWEPLDGIYGDVYALAILPNGDLLAGGSFPYSPSGAVNHIARWDGTSWSPLGGGVDGINFPFQAVTSLAVMPNGDVIAGGDFTVTGGLTPVSVNHIARWNGSVWLPMGQGLGGSPFGGSTPYCMVVLPNGDLVVGGRFTTAGGVSASHLAIWNGVSWSAMGSGVVGSSVDSLRVLPNGDLLVSGAFSSIGGVPANNIARWNGSNWAPFGTGTDGLVRTTAVLPNGDFVVGGDFATAGGVSAGNVARWDGAVWTAMGTGFEDDAIVNTLLPLPNGGLWAGGWFRTADGKPARSVARWDGVAWSPIEQGITGRSVNAILPLPTGEVVVGGAFAVTGVAGTPNIAQWDGLNWSSLGSGTDAPVHALARLPNGDLVAAGEFTTAGGVPVNRVARWNGTTWSSIGSPVQQSVFALAVLPNGDLVIGGAFPGGVLRFDGASWSPLGGGLSGGVISEVHAFVVLPNGDLVAGGSFLSAGAVPVNGIARWDGTSWLPFGAGVNGAVQALAVLPNGDLVCGGPLSGTLQRWDGATWSWPGPTPAFGLNALMVLPDGDLFVGGGFAGIGSVDVFGMARWDGSAWTAIDSTLRWEPVRAAALLANGDLMVGANDFFDAWVHRLSSTCPATAGIAGSGCSGSGGANVLTAKSLPWIGSVCRSEASGMPANGFAFVVLGFGPLAIPLATISPQGGPGCDLQVTLDVLDTKPLVAGRVSLAIAIPDTTAFVGITVRQQVLPVELDLAGNVVGFTATNPLALTIGAF